MLLEPISLNGKPQGKCIAEDCNDCAMYRLWKVIVDKTTNTEQILKKCSLESLFVVMPNIVGSIDGVQTAANEARNNSIAARNAMDNYSGAVLKSFQLIGKKLKFLR